MWSCAVLAFVIFVSGAAHAAEARHGLSILGELKYERGFPHFDYVNPDAPKGGEIVLATIGTFDSLNQYIRKGTKAGLLTTIRIYDTLLFTSEDEPGSQYGLLAESVTLAGDRSWIEFTLREEARWHDGRPVTVEDVIFTLELLKEKGAPRYRANYRNVLSAEKTGPRTVRFRFARPSRELPVILGDLAVLPKHYWEGRDFEKTTLEPPLGSGPYRITDVKPGRSLTYKRVGDYWGRDLNVNVGRFNFGRIRLEYFRDLNVRLEALKAGVVDFSVIVVSKTWGTAFEGFAPIERGEFERQVMVTHDPARVQTLMFNLRRKKFQDRRVRMALAYAYNFAFWQKIMAYDVYEQPRSYFANSYLEPKGLPSEAELALLEPYRDRLPKEVFTEEFHAPETVPNGPNRGNLEIAAQLLREAGWVVRDGRLVHAETGEPFVIEVLAAAPARIREALPYAERLKRLGIELEIRVVDRSQYVNRSAHFDYDIIWRSYKQLMVPGVELYDYFGSGAADRPYSRNYAGIADPAVDHLIEAVIGAETREELMTAAHALDRVLTWHYYGIFWGNYRGSHYAYWNRFGQPETQPDNKTGFPDLWWVDAEKDARLRRREMVAR